MKLHIYEHCPFCTRARMIFGLKALPVALQVVMEGDADTPVRLTGKKSLPILTLDDGRHMGESLDIVRHVDGLGTPVLTGPADPALDAWSADAWQTTLGLIIPRFTQGDFAELATAEARTAYRAREEKAFGDLGALLDDTPQLLADLHLRLLVLDTLLAGRSGACSLSDIVLWPVLRSLTIVDGLHFPPAVLAYVRRLETDAKVPLLFDQAR